MLSSSQVHEFFVGVFAGVTFRSYNVLCKIPENFFSGGKRQNYSNGPLHVHCYPLLHEPREPVVDHSSWIQEQHAESALCVSRGDQRGYPYNYAFQLA